jgi:hypothetical protein
METTKKYQRPQLNVICSNCDTSFLKDGSEVRRNEKIGRNNYCSLICSGNKNHKHLKEFNNSHYLEGQQDNRRDKYTVIREHLNRVKNRNKDYNITLDDLLIQWNKQKGVCPYTGIKLIPPRKAKECPIYYKASLDRIDSNIGYNVGNIQFISASANYAKHNMNHEEMIDFCKIITNQWKDL